MHNKSLCTINTTSLILCNPITLSATAITGIAGQLGTVPLAVHGVFMSTAGLFYMAPNAFASATSTLAGNFLGDDNPNDAKLTIYIGIFVDFLWGVTAGLFLLLILRPYWGLMYTDDRDVQEMIYDCLPIMFVYLSVDSTKCITLNVLRSTGRPSITGRLCSTYFFVLFHIYF